MFETPCALLTLRKFRVEEAKHDKTAGATAATEEALPNLRVSFLRTNAIAKGYKTRLETVKDAFLRRLDVYFSCRTLYPLVLYKYPDPSGKRIQVARSTFTLS